MPQPGWIKSSYSNGNGGNNCVEVAVRGAQVAMRDSKNPQNLPIMFTGQQWIGFVRQIKDGDFTLRA